MTPSPGITITNIQGLLSFRILLGSDGQPTPAGLGIFIRMGNEQRRSQLCISAVSLPVTSAIVAEAFTSMLATQIAGLLQLQQADKDTGPSGLS